MGQHEVGARQALGVGYARFSMDRQSSLEDQRQVNDRIASAHGVTLLRGFQDEAISRTLAERTGLMEMLDCLRENGDVRYIVVNELERITGDLRQRVTLADLCQELNISLLTEDGALDPFDEDHQQRADESAVGASREVRKLRKRTRRAMQSKVESGTVMMRPAFGTRMKPVSDSEGQPLPRGVRIIGANGKPVRSGVLEVDADELPWLIRMFEWVAVERCSIDGVARRLTEAGVPTKSGNAAWSRSSVRGILTNPFYKGELVWGRQKVVHTRAGPMLQTRAEGDGERIVMTSPLGALVNPDLWQRANEVLRSRAGSRPHAKRRVNPARAFDGLVFCARCGHKMYGRADAKPRKDGSKPDAWRYYCIATRPGYGQVEGFGPPCRRSNAVSERRIIQELANLAADPQQAPLVVTYASPPDLLEQEAAARRDLQQLAGRWARTLELGLAGVLDIDEMKKLKVQHDEAVAAVERRQSTLAGSSRPINDFTVEAAEALAGVCQVLTARELPAETLRAGLTDMGLVRVFADGPSVKLEWATV